MSDVEGSSPMPDDEFRDNNSPGSDPVGKKVADGSSVVREHTFEIERNDRGAHNEFVSVQDQLRESVERDLAGGAEVFHLGSSSYGGNLSLTDDERTELLNKFRVTAAEVVKRYLPSLPETETSS